MKRRNGRVALAASALLFLAACTVREKRETTITRTWPSAGIHRINVREIDGTINVVASTGDQISLVAHIESRGYESKKNEENQGFFLSRVEGDTLVLGRERNRTVYIGIPFFNRRSLTVNYDLKVPAATAMALRTVNGHITTIGVDGESEMTTVNGGIDVETEGRNELAAKSVNGSVHAKFREQFQGAQLKTVNGSVQAVLPPTASFACDLSQVNGDFEAAFPLSIHSHPGSRRVSGEVNGGRYPLRITTVNGDIQVQTDGPVPPAAVPAVAAPAVPGVPTEPVVPASPPSMPKPPSET